MRLSSPNWNGGLGICEKHLLPSVPCPACLADGGDEDLECVVTDSDMLVLDGEYAARRPTTLHDLVPGTITEPRFISACN